MRWLVLLLLVRTAHADCDTRSQKEKVAFLASAANDGRAPGSAGDVATRKYLVEQFTCLGLTPAFDGYEQPFGKTANVVGYIQGTGDDIVFVGAHHDHLGNGHLGANDDASGIVGLLTVAAAIKHPKRTIVFAAFGDEETGMVGSHFLAAHPAKALPNDRIVEFVDLDMIGTHDSHGLVAAMGAFKGMPARALLDGLVKKFPKISVASGGIARGSDFAPYCTLGVPYVFFWTPDRDCYHEKCDVADHLDYKHMADIAALATALVDALANTELDLAASRAKKKCGTKPPVD